METDDDETAIVEDVCTEDSVASAAGAISVVWLKLLLLPIKIPKVINPHKRCGIKEEEGWSYHGKSDDDDDDVDKILDSGCVFLIDDPIRRKRRDRPPNIAPRGFNL